MINNLKDIMVCTLHNITSRLKSLHKLTGTLAPRSNVKNPRSNSVATDANGKVTVLKQNTGAMIAFDMAGTNFGSIAGANAHVTLVYLGEAVGLDEEPVMAAVRDFAYQHAPIQGKFTGFAILPSKQEEGNAVVALFDSPALPAFRQALLHAIEMVMPTLEQTHGFTAHMTITYTKDPVVNFPTDYVPVDATFDTITLYIADEKTAFRLAGTVVEKEHKVGIFKSFPGHKGIPGVQGGSLPRNGMAVMSLADDVDKNDSYAKAYATSIADVDTPGKSFTKLSRTLPNGYEATYKIHKTGKKNDDGTSNYEIETNAYGDVLLKDSPVYLAGSGKQKWGEAPPMVTANSAEEAMDLALQWESTHDEMLTGKINKMLDLGRDRDASMTLSNYKYEPNKTSPRKVLQVLLGNRIAYEAARRTLDKLPMDAEGNIKLYRGGNDTGISWSTNKAAAETFARYSGIGSVDARMSGMIAAQQIRAGALDKPITIHERIFNKSELLAFMGNDYEGEVIVNPNKFTKTSKEMLTIVIDTEQNDDWMKALPGYKDEVKLSEDLNANHSA